MNILWLCVAILLHAETVLLTVLMIPWIPSTTWNVIFKCKFARKIQSYSKIYSSIVVGLLLILFVDSIREMVKYSSVVDVVEEPTIWTQNDIVITTRRLFRAERNFYLLGATLFIFLVVRRTVSLITREAHLLQNRDAVKAEFQDNQVKAPNAISAERSSSRSKKIH